MKTRIAAFAAVLLACACLPASAADPAAAPADSAITAPAPDLFAPSSIDIAMPALPSVTPKAPSLVQILAAIAGDASTAAPGVVPLGVTRLVILRPVNTCSTPPPLLEHERTATRYRSPASHFKRPPKLIAT